MDQSATEIDLLRAELAELRREFAAMRALQAHQQSPDTPTVDAATEPTAHARSTEQAAEPASGRRGFLRLAGAAAVGATAVAVVGGIEPAAAATGAPLLIGVANSSTAANDTTTLNSSSPTALDDQTLFVHNSTVGVLNPPASHRIAIAAITNGADTNPAAFRTGVYGRTAGPDSSPNTGGGQGVFGSAAGVENEYNSTQIGVFGTAAAGGFGMVGLSNTGATSVGVLGRSDEGYGLVGSSDTGVSILARNGGRIQQALRATPGSPTVGTFSRGELIRDSVGDAYICVTSGTPGTWQKLTAQHPDYDSAGGSINLLPKPIRLIDTRGGAPITNAGARLTPAVPIVAQITGTVVDGLSVPAGAKGILANLTAVAPVGSGFLVVWAEGQSFPTASNLNYSAVTGNPAIANYVITAIGPTGKLNVQCAATATHVLLDVFGFVY